MNSLKVSPLFFEELEYYGLSADGAETLACKEGIITARVRKGAGTAILKCFEKQELRRELTNYEILQSLGVPTLAVLGRSGRSILLEDIGHSGGLRLGRESDLSDPEVIKAIAKWYRTLHAKGREYVKLHGAGMFDEWDAFSRGNIEAIRERFGLWKNRGLSAVSDNYAMLCKRLEDAPRTLTYNDFYYTNLAVGNDRSAALMFDYDMLGKGCCASDISNATYWFSEENRRLFLSVYGEIDEGLMLLDRIVSPVVSLAMALSRKETPVWAEEALDKLENTPELIAELR